MQNMRTFKFKSVFSIVNKSWQRFVKISFVIFDLVEKTNRMWLSVVCTLINNDTYYHSGQNLLWTYASQVQNILTIVITSIVDNKSTEHIKHIWFVKFVNL